MGKPGADKAAVEATAAPDLRMDATLAQPGPAVAKETAEALCAQLYGIRARAQLISGERDANFAVDAADGERFFLKIVHPHEDVAVSGMHTAALLHVADRAPHLGVQTVVTCLDGHADARVELSGHWRSLRLTRAVPGIGQSKTPPSREQITQTGVTLAGLQEALADFRHPAEDHASTWDMTRAPGLAESLDAFENADERRRLASILERFSAEVGPNLPQLPHQMAHNDFNRDNILVDPDQPERITGIIDVGDMRRTPVLCDVAVATAYQQGVGDDPLGPALGFLEGFTSRRPVSSDEAALLPAAILTRMAMRLIIPQWRAARFPDRAGFILRNSARVRDQLRAWAAYPPGEPAERVAAVCRPHATGAAPP